MKNMDINLLKKAFPTARYQPLFGIVKGIATAFIIWLPHPTGILSFLTPKMGYLILGLVCLSFFLRYLHKDKFPLNTDQYGWKSLGQLICGILFLTIHLPTDYDVLTSPYLSIALGSTNLISHIRTVKEDEQIQE